jgi:hypothetical protein
MLDALVDAFMSADGLTGLFGSGHDRFMRAGVAAEGSATHLGC